MQHFHSVHNVRTPERQNAFENWKQARSFNRENIMFGYLQRTNADGRSFSILISSALSREGNRPGNRNNIRMLGTTFLGFLQLVRIWDFLQLVRISPSHPNFFSFANPSSSLLCNEPVTNLSGTPAFISFQWRTLFKVKGNFSREFTIQILQIVTQLRKFGKEKILKFDVTVQWRDYSTQLFNWFCFHSVNLHSS